LILAGLIPITDYLENNKTEKKTYKKYVDDKIQVFICEMNEFPNMESSF
jgi:hypothetical protein